MPVYYIERKYKSGDTLNHYKPYFIRSECEEAARPYSQFNGGVYPYLSARCIQGCYCKIARKKLWKAIRELKFRRANKFMWYGLKTIYYDLRYELGDRINRLPKLRRDR